MLVVCTTLPFAFTRIKFFNYNFRAQCTLHVRLIVSVFTSETPFDTRHTYVDASPLPPMFPIDQHRKTNFVEACTCTYTPQDDTLIKRQPLTLKQRWQYEATCARCIR